MAEGQQQTTEAPKVKRAVHTFDVPKKLAAEVGHDQVGLQELTSEEELLAFRRSKGDKGALTAELVKASIVEADGKKLSAGDGSVDTFWNGLHPKLRALVMEAYSSIHSAAEEDEQSFLGSRKVRVG